MRYLLPLLALLTFMVACAPQEAPYPKDLEGKQTMLKEKETELRELTKMVDQLKSEIDVLDPSQKEVKRVLVTTQPVEVKEFKRYTEIQAAVQADDMVMASSEMGGRMTAMKWKEGDYIKKGALVASVDMEAVNKSIAELETSLELANEVYNRQKRLWDQNIGSEIQYLQAENNKKRLEKSLETVKFNLTKANVYAPISGFVDRVFSNAGEMAGPGTPIIAILNTGKVKVVASVPERYLSAVKRGEMVTIKFPALDKEIKSRVSLLGRSIDPSNRTFPVEVNLNNSGGQYKPNLLALVLINDFSQKDAITVPLELVQQEVGGNDFVYVQGQSAEGDIAKKMYIKTSESFEGEIIVTEGLTGDEQLIMSGARNITEGQAIEVKNTIANNEATTK